MSDFPYSNATGKIKPFFEKIHQVGIPEAADKKWLASIGFMGTNDQRIVSVLKFIEFVDQSGKPTDRWVEYRDKSRFKKVLAEAIKKGYAELFQTYPDAHQRNVDELKNFFSTRTKGGAQVISYTVTTFNNLCEMADFNNITREPQASQEQAPRQETKVELGTTKNITQGLGAGVAININIQLTVPDTTDEVVYDKFFAALKKHLLS
ncbi:MAG: DUF5343 domain-containing protein [Candidatus Methanoperedens sp.]|nr:DUF5343 domain-containing protein [Candidatus Methanoperedens sp.]